MRKPLVALGFLVVAGALTSACSPKDPCGEPFYAGKGSDEAWRTLIDAEKKVVLGHERAPVLVEPVEGQSYPSGSALRFRWTSPLRASLQPHPSPARLGSSANASSPSSPSPLSEFSPLSASTAQSSPWPTLKRTLGNALLGEAWAHLPPVTGDIYVVEVSIPGQSCPLRALTTELEWQATRDATSALRAASGKDVSVRLTGAYLRDNRLEEGPYRMASPVVFRTEP